MYQILTQIAYILTIVSTLIPVPKNIQKHEIMDGNIPLGKLNYGKSSISEY